MNKTVKNLISEVKQRVSLRFVAEVLTVVLLFHLCLWMSPWGSRLHSQFTRPKIMTFRQWLGLTPQLDERLKIYVLDRKTSESLGTRELSTTHWKTLFERLNQLGPSKVILDESFSYLRHSKDIESLKIASQKSSFDTILIGEYEPNHAKTLESESALANSTDWEGASWFAKNPGVLNGPPLSLSQAFPNLSHFTFLPASGGDSVPMLLKMRNQSPMPMTPLLMGSWDLREGELHFEGEKVPISKDGLLAINPVSIKVFQDKVRPLQSLFEDDPPQLQHGSNDVILILPYSLQQKWVESALGPVPRGFVLTSALNSMLTHQWIHRPAWGFVWLLFGCLLAFALAITLEGAAFWSTVLACQVLWLLGTALIFSRWGIEVESLLPWLEFAGLSPVLYAHRMNLRERNFNRVREALEGVVPKRHLKELIKVSSAELLAPRSEYVTVMFLDIVGFSNIAQKRSPKEVFRLLRETLGGITEIVHQHGGMVDKTLGDGMLCFFGYRFHGPRVENHEAVALSCAKAIQRWAGERLVESAKNELPLFPLRIGLNSGETLIGDIGGRDKVDLTIIGDTVNLAQRLETACESFRIMMGASTLDAVSDGETAIRYEKRLMKVKHYSELLEAYEIDPLEETGSLATEIREVMRHHGDIERTDHRWGLPEDIQLNLDTSFGCATIINFSQRGVCIDLPVFLAVGVTFEVEIPLKKAKQQVEIVTVSAEIRWGKTIKKGCYRHGVLLKNLNQLACHRFIQALRSEIQSFNPLRKNTGTDD